MNDVAARRQPRSLLPELSELFSGSPSRAGQWPLIEGHLIRTASVAVNQPAIPVEKHLTVRAAG